MIFQIKRIYNAQDRWRHSRYRMLQCSVVIFCITVGILLFISSRSFPVNSNDSVASTTECEQIHQLLQQMEYAYANRDIEGYMSVFHERFEYQSDMGTPDDPSDDITGITKELERESALRVFEQFYAMQIDLLSNLKITVDGDTARAEAEYTIVGETFDPGNWTWYTLGKNIFYLIKKSHQWQIIRWQDNALSLDTIEQTRTNNDERTFDDLIAALGGDLQISATAMLALEELAGSESMAAGLLTVIKKHNGSQVRARAARLLSRTELDDTAILSLVHILEDAREDAALRVAILSTLATQHNSIASGALIRAAVDGHPQVRAFATFQLTRMKSADAQKHIIDALGDSEAHVRRAATEAVIISNELPNEKLIVPLKTLIHNPTEELPVRKSALRAFIKYIPSEARAMLLNVLIDTSMPDELRIEAAHILEEHPLLDKPQEIEDNLLEIFYNTHVSEPLRAAAISALSRYGTAKSIEPLTLVLNSESRRFKARACNALGRIHARNTSSAKRNDFAGMKILELARNKTEHIHVRRMAVEALRRLELPAEGVEVSSHREAVNILIQLMKDKNEPGNFRGAIVTALSQWPDARAEEALLNLIADNSAPWWLRRAAVKSLKNEREDRAMAVLNQLLNAPDERLRQAAEEKLR